MDQCVSLFTIQIHMCIASDGHQTAPVCVSETSLRARLNSTRRRSIFAGIAFELSELGTQIRSHCRNGTIRSALSSRNEAMPEVERFSEGCVMFSNDDTDCE